METLLVPNATRIPFREFRPGTDADAGEFAPPRNAMPDYLMSVDNRLLEMAMAELFLSNSLTPRRFNPLVFHGATGTGKTHLVLGLVNIFRTQLSRRGGLIVTGADWSRAYTKAIENNDLLAWRDQCRQATYFLLDDIHALHRKFAAQRELVSLLDDLVAIDVPCVLTSRTNPLAVSELLPELAGRLSAGLTIPLHPPDLATRQVYLDQLAREHGIELTSAAVELLAEAVDGAVPELRAAFLQMAPGLPLDRKVDALEMRRLLRRQAEPNNDIPLSSIATVVARHYQLSKAKLTSATRKRCIAHARCIAIYLSRELTSTTLKGIGAFFGGRDHTTVLHAYRKIEELLESDPATQSAVAVLTNQLLKGRA